ncbi:MAG: SRPBCC family protein [Anaerolineae bacterium]|nr:SRPBCC family protein [Anaerolineae bacterium]
MTSLNLVAEPGMHSIVLTREFNAPREVVFKAFTDATLVPKWWGPRYLTTKVDAMDVKFGGVWRYVQRDADGNEYAFRGVYHQITAPERLVFTFEFEGMPGHVLLETVMLEDRGDKTLVTDTSIFQSIEDRDGMIASGMEGGAADSWDRFAELLATL